MQIGGNWGKRDQNRIEMAQKSAVGKSETVGTKEVAIGPTKEGTVLVETGRIERNKQEGVTADRTRQFSSSRAK